MVFSGALMVDWPTLFIAMRKKMVAMLVERYGEDIKIGESGWWRSWSGKNIVSKEDAGRWKVVVTNVSEQDNEVLCVVHFLVK